MVVALVVPLSISSVALHIYYPTTRNDVVYFKDIPLVSTHYRGEKNFLPLSHILF